MTDRQLVLHQPRYSYAEADRIVGLTRGTTHRWLKGYQYLTDDGRIIRQPQVSGARAAEPGVSFVELIEVAGIARLRDLKLSLRRIRALVKYAAQMFDTEYPLATLAFRLGGRDVFVDDRLAKSLVEVSGRQRRRAWVEVLAPFLETVDYGTDGLAERWWPLGRGSQIVVDPDYGFGQPVVHGSGVRTESIWEQLLAGSGVQDIADDFGISADLVERAIQFEGTRAEAASAAS